MGRNTVLLCTTKRRITTNLKTINNQNCQKIKLHGCPTTKRLKKHSSRPVGGCGDSHQFKNKKQPELPENQTAWKSDNQGVKETFIPTGKRGADRRLGQRGQGANVWVRWGLADQETKDSKPLPLKSCGVLKAAETPSLAGEFLGKRS